VTGQGRGHILGGPKHEKNLMVRFPNHREQRCNAHISVEMFRKVLSMARKPARP